MRNQLLSLPTVTMTNAARAAALALLSVLAACSSSSSSTPAAGADLDGTWQTSCYQKSKTELHYTHLALTGTYTAYADDACASPISVSTWTGNVATTGAAAGATKIDISFQTYTVKPLVAQAASYDAMNAFCGITDWTAGVERDVLGKTCTGFSIPVDGKSLDIYLVQGNTLTFGKGSKISAAPVEADRPTVLDDQRVFTKS